LNIKEIKHFNCDQGDGVASGFACSWYYQCTLLLTGSSCISHTLCRYFLSHRWYKSWSVSRLWT